MIKIKDLTFKYSGSKEPALKDISLDIQAGDFIGIIGTSGAGKTSLALALNGVIPHQLPGDFYGSVKVDGLDTIENGPEKFCRRIGEVFQDIDSQMVASIVEDEILFGLENFGYSREEIASRLEKALADLGITKLRHREISSLSGGQKQKVAIAALLALEPEIMVLDEPTGELDPESSIEIFELLQKLNREKGITIVIVEQKIMLLCAYVKRLLVLDKGNMQFIGAPREGVADVKMFKELGINVPPVAELSDRLRDAGLYAGDVTMTVPEAAKMVKEVMAR